MTCRCDAVHRPRTIVLTGGPGAGKTAILELIRRTFCRHVAMVPESAGIVFGGGFPRSTDPRIRRCSQRAIFYVQRELEAATKPEDAALVLCDRGTIDGAAYWPGPGEPWAEVGTTLDEQLSHYDAVIHLRTPPANGGYNHRNPLRVETAAEAAAIDARIAAAWASHPRRFEIPSEADFLVKAERAIAIVRELVPACCAHVS